jgi:tRNA A-37 threonylcarbamoyl transferase component Bud32
MAYNAQYACYTRSIGKLMTLMEQYVGLHQDVSRDNMLFERTLEDVVSIDLGFAKHLPTVRAT